MTPSSLFLGRRRLTYAGSRRADKSLLIKRHFISAIFDLFDEIVKKAKKELGSVTIDSLQIVINPLCNLPEDRLPNTQKRESLVDVMRSMLNSDTSIEDDDISNS